MQLSELLETDTKLYDVEVFKTDSDMFQIVGTTSDKRLVNLGRCEEKGRALEVALDARNRLMQIKALSNGK